MSKLSAQPDEILLLVLSFLEFTPDGAYTSRVSRRFARLIRPGGVYALCQHRSPHGEWTMRVYDQEDLTTTIQGHYALDGFVRGTCFEQTGTHTEFVHPTDPARRSLRTEFDGTRLRSQREDAPYWTEWEYHIKPDGRGCFERPLIGFKVEAWSGQLRVHLSHPEGQWRVDIIRATGRVVRVKHTWGWNQRDRPWIELFLYAEHIHGVNVRISMSITDEQTKLGVISPHYVASLIPEEIWFAFSLFDPLPFKVHPEEELRLCREYHHPHVAQPEAIPYP